jgi:two-component system sensor histidine kinase/response regulator
VLTGIATAAAAGPGGRRPAWRAAYRVAGAGIRQDKQDAIRYPPSMGSSTSRSATRRFLAAGGAVAAATAAHLAMGPLGSGATDVALAALAIGFSAWYGGSGPGLSATALAFLLGIIHALGSDDQGARTTEALSILVMGVLIIAMFQHRGERAQLIAVRDQEGHHRRRTEQSMVLERQRLQTLMDHIPDRIYFKDRVGRYELVNRYIADCYHIPSPSDAVGKSDFDYFTAEHAQPAYDDEQEIIRSGRPLIGKEEKETWPDGSVTWVSTTKLPMRDEGGQTIGIVGISRDITERVRATEALEHATVTADQANLAKGHFLANMSHEIRTPMSAIVGMTELLMDGGLTPEQREFAEIIQKAGTSLLAMISDILDFSKIEAGKLGLESIPFDLARVLEDVAELHAPNAEARGLELIQRIAPGTPTRLVGDPGRLRQVLNNLVGNAIKFTPKGHILIDVSTISAADRHAVLRIAVEDSGIGIAADKVASIFDKFTQADSSTTREYGGTGLGLAICKEIAHAMSGSLTVTSVHGQGSTFVLSISLPFDESPPPQREAPVALKKLHVLVVEPSPVIQRVYSEQLIAWGCLVDTCPDGAAAIARLARARYAFVLIDWNLPDQAGIELGRQIRAAPANAGIGLVLITSVGQRGDGKAASEAGFDAYLVKPVRMLDLAGALSAVHQARQEGQPPTTLITRHRLAEVRGHSSSSRYFKKPGR